MIRITEIQPMGRPLRLVVEGRLSGDAAGALARAARRPGLGARDVEIDVSRVTFADEEGLGALRSLRAEGTAVVNAAGFVRLMLEECAQ